MIKKDKNAIKSSMPKRTAIIISLIYLSIMLYLCM